MFMTAFYSNTRKQLVRPLVEYGDANSQDATMLAMSVAFDFQNGVKLPTGCFVIFAADVCRIFPLSQRPPKWLDDDVYDSIKALCDSHLSLLNTQAVHAA